MARYCAGPGRHGLMHWVVLGLHPRPAGWHGTARIFVAAQWRPGEHYGLLRAH